MPRLPESRAEQEPTTAKQKSSKYVDMKSDAGRQMMYGGEKILIAVGNFAAHHNGMVITCDSTVRYSDSHMQCFGNVLIKKGTTYIYGDRAEYDGEINEAKIYSDIIKVVDQGTTMYTYNFTFNTQTNIGVFVGGGVVLDDNNRLEAERGYYNADTKDIICVNNVEMRDEKYQMKGDSVIYNMDSNNARFFRNTNIWNTEDNEYLYADCGEFKDSIDLYRLTENGYILTEEQELWSDSLDYYREQGYALLKSNIQIDDITQKVLVFGDLGEYWKEPGNAFLTEEPVLISYDTEQGDTVFIRSDSMYLYTIDPVAERIERERLAKIKADSIAAAKAAEALRDSLAAVALQDSLANVARQDSLATATAALSDQQTDENNISQQSEEVQTPAAAQKEERAEQPTEDAPADNMSQRAEQARAALDKAKAKREQTPEQSQEIDELTEQEPKEVAEPTDSLATDSLAADSLLTDSLANPLDTLTAKQRLALEKAAAKAAKQHIRDSIKQIKADSLQKKLDAIAERRQAQRTEYYKRLERADSIYKAKERQLADKKLRKRLAKLARRGIEIKPVHDSVFVSIDSLMYADSMQYMAPAIRMLDSLVEIYFPRKEAVDTTAVATDTIPVDSTYKLILALRKVKMYRSDAQMICDSLRTVSIDSIIHLYKEPVMWSDKNQITADSMHIHSTNGALTKAVFDGNPMTVEQIDTAHYNQVAGKEMISYFKDNEIYRNDMNGNVQTIYYMQEEDNGEISMMAYIESGDMSAYIDNKQLTGITYRTNPTYFFYPMDKIPEDRETKLQNFKWEAHRRPSRDSIFTRTIRATQRETKTALPRPFFPIERNMELKKQRLIRSGAWIDRTDTLSIETIEWVESVQD